MGGLSALVTAVKCHHRGLVSDLLKRGEDRNLACPETGKTALYTAVDMLLDVLDDGNKPGPTVVVAELLRSGADLDAIYRYNTGRTPFHDFMRCFHKEDPETVGLIILVEYCWNSKEVHFMDQFRYLFGEMFLNKKNPIIG